MKFLVYFLCSVLLSNIVTSKGLKEEFTWTRISYSLPRNKRAVDKAYQGSLITFPGNTNSDQINRTNQTSDNADVNFDYIYRK